jgi:hypothetical protein
MLQKMQLYKQQLDEAERMNRKLLEDVTRLEQEKSKTDGKVRWSLFVLSYVVTLLSGA